MFTRNVPIDIKSNDCQILSYLPVQSNFNEIHELLLIHKANPSKATKEGSTPLHIASQYESDKRCEALLARESQSDAVDGKGETLFDFVRENNKKSFISLF